MAAFPVLIIAGPTASGKSALAIEVARARNGVIINCDAMQIYKDIPIIAATPSPQEKAAAEHRLYELYDCSKRGNVVEWLDLCVNEIQALWQEGRLPIVVGGTGMYIDALLNGVTPIPEVPADIRRAVQQELNTRGLLALYTFLQEADPASAAKLHVNDKTRITRAVEIIRHTGRKLSEWYTVPLLKKLPQAKFTVVKIAPPLEDIAARCRARLDKMVDELNVLAEIEKLAALDLPADLPAMKALGVPELLEYVKGRTTLKAALDLAKLHTRQYAKRQRTWLKNKLPADLEFTTAYTGQPDYLPKILDLLK